MKLLALFALLILPACYTGLPADGALRCNTQSAKQCPSGFYCADDGACWRDGHTPTSMDMSVPEQTDMGTEMFDLSDRTCSVDTCAGNVLRTCSMGTFNDTTCALGCSSTGAPHCNGFYPSAPVTMGDLTMSGVTAVTLPATTLHGDTGAIDGVRAANTDPTQLEVNGGIAFHRVSGVGVFIFGGLTITDGVTVHLAGPNPIALVSTMDMNVGGVIDAQGSCMANVAVAGGSLGGPASNGGDGTAGMGPGAGGGGQSEGASNCLGAGGGGAGHAGLGGKGGNGGCFTPAMGGSAGATYDTSALTTLRGGSGGGSGGSLAGMGTGGGGGSGGGALQLVAAGVITVGSAGGVNAGGCGGAAGNGTVTGGGGGGGSGGALIVEAPTVRMLASAVLAANGGGGGGVSAGGNGSLSAVRAPGGGSGTRAPGRGGAGAVTSGEAGVDSTSSGDGSGGGGGAAGFIRISAFGTPSIDATATVSPIATETQIDAH